MITPPVDVTNILDTESVEGFLVQQAQAPEAISSGFPSWDRECRDAGGGKGLALGWHVVVAGGTGVGKTIVVLNVCRMAVETENVGIVSLEMSRCQLQTRTLAMLSGEPVARLECGDSFDVATGRAVLDKVRDSRGLAGNIYVNEGPISDIGQICSLMAYYHEVLECSLLVVDYLQLVRARDADSLLAQTTTVSARVREFAAGHRVVTLGVSQFNRETSGNYTDRPRIQGLMGGSPLENDSDQVLLLDHRRFERDGSRAKTWLCLDKNRHGALVQIPIEFDFRTLRVREAMPDEEIEWPGSGQFRQ